MQSRVELAATQWVVVHDGQTLSQVAVLTASSACHPLMRTP